jgi:aspartate/methionine/tyrosine aminotransferase
VWSAERLRASSTGAARTAILVASDECYLELGWDAEPVSVLDPAVCGGSADGVLAVHSLSKRSNLAGYRAGLRRRVTPPPSPRSPRRASTSGLLVPAPVQAALVAALATTRTSPSRRRGTPPARGAAARRAGGRLHRRALRGRALPLVHPRRGCWETVEALASVGVLARPGAFYGAAGARHVRFALTATDERIAAAAERLRRWASEQRAALTRGRMRPP